MNDRIDWATVVSRAADIVRSYDIPITLRQLFYRLVSDNLIPNQVGPYKKLSERTAKLRRSRQFPALFDRGRTVLKPSGYDSPHHAVDAAARWYRRDRTEGQRYQVWLGVEKNALAGLMEDWFGDYGVPVLPLGGYSSESIDRQVVRDVSLDGRPAILIYGGDFDPSGMDIGRNFIDNTTCWHRTIRVGLSEQQIADLSLPVLEGKATDSRAPRFIATHPVIHTEYDFGCDAQGRRIPVQVELDAVDPHTLRDWYLDALADYWDDDTYADVLTQEDADRDLLRRVADDMAVAG
jgi:hypothetical protein